MINHAGLTVCAERICLGAALTAGKRDYVLMAVATKDGGSSCGACRQLLAEYCPRDMPIIFVDSKGKELKRMTPGQMLPESFSFCRPVEE